jgi:hypothetical protein
LACWKEQKAFEKVFSDLTSLIENLHCILGTQSAQQQKCPETLKNMAQDTFFSKDSQEIQICSMEQKVAEAVDTN